MSDTNRILNYMASVVGEQQPTGSAEVATVEAPAPTENQVSAEVAAETTVEQQVIAPEEAQVAEAEQTQQPEAVDYWKQFEERTEGLVKDEESFNSILSKAKEYEELAKQKEELEKNQWKPANDYVDAFDKLIKEGASKDQIKAFVKLNDFGDINELSPIDAKVAKMVLVDKYSEDVARKIVTREFDIEEFDEGSDDRMILEEKLRISALQDKEALQSYKKDLSIVNNPDKEAAEQTRLAEIANTEAYNKSVVVEAPKIAGYFPKKFDYELVDGDTKIPFEHVVDQKFINEELPEKIKEYFLNTGDAINKDTIANAFMYVNAEYLAENHSKILKDVWDKASSYFTEKISNKYENRSGLPQAAENVSPSQVGTMNKEFMNRLLGRNRN